MTTSEKTLAIKATGGIYELFGVILEQTFTFFIDNFIKDGKISLPKFLNPFFIYNAAKFVIKLASIIKLYKENYSEFKRLYLDKVSNITKIDELFKNANSL